MHESERMEWIVLEENLRHLLKAYYSPKQIYVNPKRMWHFAIPERNIASSKVQLLYFANFLPSKRIKKSLESLAIFKNERNKYFWNDRCWSLG